MFPTAPPTLDSRKFCNWSAPLILFLIFLIFYFFFPNFQETRNGDSHWSGDATCGWMLQVFIQSVWFLGMFSATSSMSKWHTINVLDFLVCLPKSYGWQIPPTTFHWTHEDMVGALLNLSKWHASTNTVCGAMVDFSNSTNNVNHWIKLGIVSSNQQLRLTKIGTILSFKFKVEMQKL